MGAANQKIEYIARVFGETGMRELMGKIRALAAKYCHKEEMYQVAGNRYKAADPRRWVKERDVRVMVGLGNNGMNERDMALRYIQSMQEKIIAAQQGNVAGPMAAMVDAENVHNAITDALENMGIYEEMRYFRKPDMQVLTQMAVTPPPPDPAVVVAEKELKIKEESKLVDSQIEMAIHQDEMDVKKRENELKEKEIALKEKQIDLEFKRFKIDAKTRVSEEVALSDDDLNEGEAPMGKITDAIVEALAKQGQAIETMARKQDVANERLYAALTRPKKIVTDSET